MKISKKVADQYLVEESIYGLEDSVSLQQLELYLKSSDPYAKVLSDDTIDSKYGNTLFEKIGNDTIYYRIDTFDESTYNSFSKVVDEGKYLILDLRNNQGGLLEEALKVVELLSNKSSIVIDLKDSSHTKKFDSQRHFESVVCLMSNNTISSGELVAGVLKESNSDFVIGDSQTFGKNTIQKVVSYNAVKFHITIGKFIFQHLGDIEFKGVYPDILCDRYNINFKSSYFGKLSTKDEIRLGEFGVNIFSLQQRLNFLIENTVKISGKCDIETLQSVSQIAGVDCKSIITSAELKRIDKLFYERINSFEYDKQLSLAIEILNDLDFCRQNREE